VEILERRRQREGTAKHKQNRHLYYEAKRDELNVRRREKNKEKKRTEKEPEKNKAKKRTEKKNRKRGRHASKQAVFALFAADSSAPRDSRTTISIL